MGQLALVGKKIGITTCSAYEHNNVWSFFYVNYITQMLMSVWSSLLAIQMPHVPTHLELTPVAVMRATLEMEQFAVVYIHLPC